MEPSEIFLSVTFLCGILISGFHVWNHAFVAPVYDVILNLLAFLSAVTAAILLGQWISASLAGCAVIAWVFLGLRTLRHPRDRRTGQR